MTKSTRRAAVPSPHHVRAPGAFDLAAVLAREWFLAVGVATGLIFLFFDDVLFAQLSNTVWLVLIFLWLFAAVLGSAMSVVRHADHLAERLGEPYGTLILTLAVTSIEVMGISAVMAHGDNNPTLVRDTLFAVVMIILGGMVGLSLLVGAWRNREQHHNLQGANAYLGVIIPLATLSLILPTFTVTTEGPTFSLMQQIVLGIISVALYATFLLLQTGRHRGYFIDEGTRDVDDPEDSAPAGPIWNHVILLAAYMVPVVFLVDHLARPIDYVTETLHAPAALGGLAMAVLVATPEGISAVRAALSDRLQRSVNIFLGSVLSTIGITVPAMLAIGYITGHNVLLGLEQSDLVMLVLTLAVSMITFASGRTNLLQGAVHLLLFVTYFLLLFQD